MRLFRKLSNVPKNHLARHCATDLAIEFWGVGYDALELTFRLLEMTIRKPWQWFGAIAIATITAVLYLPFIGNEMVFDDQNISAMMLSYADIPFDGRPRTFPYFTLAFTKVIFGAIEAHRIVSLLIHIANALLLWSVLDELLTKTSGKSNGYSRWLALFGAIAFVVHPIAVYGAAYLAQRTILFALFFSLLSLRVFMRWMESDKKWDVVAAALFYALAVFSKEHTLLVPAAVVSVALLYRPDLKTQFSKAWPYLALTLPVALYVALQMKGIIGTRYEPFISDLSKPENGSWWLSAGTQTGLFFDYLRLWLLPDLGRMSIDIRIPISSDRLVSNVFAFLAFGIGALALLFRSGRLALLGYGMTYCWTLFVVELSAVRFQEIFVLYRSYLWAPGFALVWVALLGFIPTTRLKTIVGVLSIGVLAWQAHDRLESFRTSLIVWTDARDKLGSDEYPGAFRIYANRAQVLSTLGRHEEALKDANHAVSLNDKSATAHAIRGFLLLKLKDSKHALADFDAALANWDSEDIFRGYLYFGRHNALIGLGRRDEAKAALDQAKRFGIRPVEISEAARESIMKLRSNSHQPKKTETR